MWSIPKEGGEEVRSSKLREETSIEEKSLPKGQIGKREKKANF